MRLINADALIADINECIDAQNDNWEFERTIGLTVALECISDAPTIEPEQRWIPCSERLPEHRLYVLVTYKYEYGLIDNGITWYSETENKWNTSREVIAWMPLPEPYKGEEE